MTVMTLEELNTGYVQEWVWDVYSNEEDARNLNERWCQNFFISDLDEETMKHYDIYTCESAYKEMEKDLEEGTIVRLWNLRRGVVTPEDGGYYYEGGEGSFCEYQIVENGVLVPWDEGS